MRIVQFEHPGEGRRLGVVREDDVLDVTALHPTLRRVTDAFALAQERSATLAGLLGDLLGSGDAPRLTYIELLANRTLASGPVIRPPLDHSDPHCVFVAGTGLTHLGSMESRDKMHAAADHRQDRSGAR